MARPPVPDPSATPLPSEDLSEDAGAPDTAPVEDTGPAGIDIEREQAGVGPDGQPLDPAFETRLPPD